MGASGARRVQFDYMIGAALAALLALSAIAQELRPRPATVKPAVTVIGASDSREIITVKFKDGLNVRLRQDTLRDDVTGALTSPQADAALKAVQAGRWRRSHRVSEE